MYVTILCAEIINITYLLSHTSLDNNGSGKKQQNKGKTAMNALYYPRLFLLTAVFKLV